MENDRERKVGIKEDSKDTIDNVLIYENNQNKTESEQDIVKSFKEKFKVGEGNYNENLTDEEEGKVENKEEKDENNKNEKMKKLSKEEENCMQVQSIQEIDLNNVVDGIETLAKRLDLEEYSKILVIYSEKVKDINPEKTRNNSTYSLVGITKDGKAKLLDDEFEIDPTYGINGDKNQTKIRANGEATRDKEDLSVYRRKTNGIGIGCERDLDSINVFMYQKTLEENENVGIQVETSKTPIIQLQTKEVTNRYKGMYQADNVQDEIQEHTDHGCEPTNPKDYDGKEETETHEHIDIDKIVQEILDYTNEQGEQAIGEQFTYNEVKEQLLKKIENNKDMDMEKIIQKVENDMNFDAEMEQARTRHGEENKR